MCVCVCVCVYVCVCVVCVCVCVCMCVWCVCVCVYVCVVYVVYVCVLCDDPSLPFSRLLQWNACRLHLHAAVQRHLPLGRVLMLLTCLPLSFMSFSLPSSLPSSPSPSHPDNWHLPKPICKLNNMVGRFCIVCAVVHKCVQVQWNPS